MPTDVSPPLSWQRLPATSALADAGLCRDWDALNAQHGDLPFLAASAIRIALRTFGESNELLCIGRRAGGVAAMLVLTAIDPLRWRTFQPSQVPLGAWVAEAGESIGELAASLQSALPGCLVLSLTQVDSRFFPMPENGPSTTAVHYIDTAWIDVTGTFADYWEARGKNLRQNLRKQRNKLAAEGRHTELREWRQREHMAAALERYGRMESQGWKAEEGTAIHADNTQGRFYRDLLEDAATRGEAAIYEYLIDNQTVAMNLCLLRGGQLVVLKTTYAETHKALSPAFLLREDELRNFFGGTEVRRIETYGRVMEWHTRLTENQRGIYHFTCYRWSWLKRLAVARAAHCEARAGSANLNTASCANSA